MAKDMNARQRKTHLTMTVGPSELTTLSWTVLRVVISQRNSVTSMVSRPGMQLGGIKKLIWKVRVFSCDVFIRLLLVCDLIVTQDITTNSPEGKMDPRTCWAIFRTRVILNQQYDIVLGDCGTR